MIHCNLQTKEKINTPFICWNTLKFFFWWISNILIGYEYISHTNQCFYFKKLVWRPQMRTIAVRFSFCLHHCVDIVINRWTFWKNFLRDVLHIYFCLQYRWFTVWPSRSLLPAGIQNIKLYTMTCWYIYTFVLGCPIIIEYCLIYH